MTTSQPWIAGFGFSHNGSVCLLRGNEIVVAIQEERLNRRKRSTLPYGVLNSMAFDYCLRKAGIQVRDIALFVIAHNGKHLSSKQRARVAGLPPELNDRALFVPHYLAHAYAAFAMSGFKESTILVLDGLGESLSGLESWFPEELSSIRHAKFARPEGKELDPNHIGEIVGIYRAEGTSIELVEKHIGGWLFGDLPLRTFGSFGAMFSSVASLVFGDELDAGKVMGLAPYGRSRYRPTDFVEVSANGTIEFHNEVCEQFNEGREPWPANRAAFEDLARGVQGALDSGLARLVARCRDLGGSSNLCYTGGVALNSVANEKVISQRFFDHHFVLPASEDSGLAIGAAYYGSWQVAPRPRSCPQLSDAMGREYGSSDVARAVAEVPFVEVIECDDPIDLTVESLLRQQVVGWFQGGSELGPRALGQRSILADPRSADMKERLNSRVKFRESFRPFAPVILAEEFERWFGSDVAEPESSFMLRVFQVRDSMRARVPSVIHVDGSARVQTVGHTAAPRLRRLLEMFFEETGVPMLLNTSFNMAGEPIVETPSDALWCMLSTGIDLLVIEDVVTVKSPRPAHALDLVPVPRRGLATAGSQEESNSNRSSLDGTGDPATVLGSCNAARTGWQLLDCLGSPWTPARLLRALSRLRIAGLVDLVRG